MLCTRLPGKFSVLACTRFCSMLSTETAPQVVRKCDGWKKQALEENLKNVYVCKTKLLTKVQRGRHEARHVKKTNGQ